MTQNAVMFFGGGHWIYLANVACLLNISKALRILTIDSRQVDRTKDKVLKAPSKTHFTSDFPASQHENLVKQHEIVCFLFCYFYLLLWPPVLTPVCSLTTWSKERRRYLISSFQRKPAWSDVRAHLIYWAKAYVYFLLVVGKEPTLFLLITRNVGQHEYLLFVDFLNEK